MFGFPDQTVEEMLGAFEFVYNLGVKIFISQFSPVPGTPEFARAVEHYSFDPAEPLASNKSAFPLRNRTISYQAYEKVRDFSKYLNKNIGRGLDVRKEVERWMGRESVPGI